MGVALFKMASFPVKIEFEVHVKHSILMNILKIAGVQGTFVMKWLVLKGF